MQYYSTRSTETSVTAGRAIVLGASPDGGLFVPVVFPTFTEADIEVFGSIGYADLATEILSLFFPEVDKAQLKNLCTTAYGCDRFGAESPVRLVHLNKNLSALELWHGPTHAFKDLALQLMPHLLTQALQIEGSDRRVLVLTATSGDTGKAALAGFSDVENAEIAVFFPANGVSEVQKLQMIAHQARNAAVYAVDGNFDDAQNGVKKAFNSADIRTLCDQCGIYLSSANSINIGRLLPQMVYYIFAYARLVQDGRIAPGASFDVSVPTGNFGNILSAWYARKMGVHIRRLLCASNSNHVLTDLFATGEYSANRPFYNTLSPSMDILISSNLERLLFDLLNHDGGSCAQLMRELTENKRYTLSESVREAMSGVLVGHWASDAATLDVIGQLWQAYGYCADPHTAVAFAAENALRKDDIFTLVVSTASPFKFPDSVLRGLGAEPAAHERDSLLKLSQLIGTDAPPSLLGLWDLPVRFSDVCALDQISSVVERLLKR